MLFSVFFTLCRPFLYSSVFMLGETKTQLNVYALIRKRCRGNGGFLPEALKKKKTTLNHATGTLFNIKSCQESNAVFFISPAFSNLLFTLNE